jgi:hypothetical protein
MAHLATNGKMTSGKLKEINSKLAEINSKLAHRSRRDDMAHLATDGKMTSGNMWTNCSVTH